MKPLFKTIIALSTGLLLGSCNAASFISGSSSMRIEVDVYKGALANTVDVQKGQLSIVLGSSRTALEDMDGQLITSMCRIGCWEYPGNLASDIKTTERAIRTTTTTMSQSSDTVQMSDISQKSKKRDKSQKIQMSQDNISSEGQTYTQTDVEISRKTKTEAAIKDIILETNIHNPSSFPFTHDQNISNRLPKHYAYDELLKSDGLSANLGAAYPQSHVRLLTPSKEQCGLAKVPTRSTNSVNSIKPKNRFYTCNVYVRMRHQVRNVKWSLDGYLNKDVNNFLTPVKIKRQALTEEQEENLKKAQKACKTITDAPKRAACESATETLRVAQKTLIDQAITNRSSAEALKSNRAEFIKYLRAAAAVANQSSQRIQPLTAQYEVDFALVSWLKDLKALKAQIEANTKKGISAPLVQAHNNIPQAVTITNATTLASADSKVKAFEETRKAMHSEFNSLNNIVKNTRTSVSDAMGGVLSNYIAGTPIQPVALLKTERESQALSARFKSLESATTEYFAASAVLKHQYDVNAAFTVLKPKTTFFISPKDTSTADIQTQLQTLKGVLAEYVSIWVKGANQAGWGHSEPTLLAINQKVLAVQSAMNVDASKLKIADDDTTPSELSALIKAVNALSAQTLPPEKLGNTKKARERLNTLMAESTLPAPKPGTPRPPTQRSYETLSANFVNRFSSQSDDLGSEITPWIDGIQNAVSTIDLPSGKAVFAAKEAFDDTVKAYNDILNEFANTPTVEETEQADHEADAYSDIAAIAGSMRVLATAITFQMAAVEPTERRLLIDMAKTANLGAELSNQLTARANALNMQIGDGKNGPIDRRLLSTGQYLRDTQPTAFLDLYDWLEASTRGRTSTKNRINVAKRLFENDNWSRVNEVYASGSGDVSMAFIRDEIGNWNLKSFSNDPSDLTAAHTNLTLGLLDKAADLAKGSIGAPAFNAAERAADIATLTQAANAAQTGDTSAANNELRSGALLSGVDMQAFRNKMVAEIKAAEATHTAAMQTYPSDETAIKSLIIVSDNDIFKDEDGKLRCQVEVPEENDNTSESTEDGNDGTEENQAESETPEEKAQNCRRNIIKEERAKANEAAKTKVKTVITRYKNFVEALQIVAAQ